MSIVKHMKEHAILGVKKIKKLTDLSDATITSPSNKEVIIYTDTSSAFLNRALRESDIGDNFDILTFTSGTTVFAVGDSSCNPAFTATYVYSVTSASVIDNQGNASAALTPPATSFNYNNSYTKTANNSTVLFTLTANDGTGDVTENRYFYWRPLVFWGVDSTPASTEVFIESLSETALDNNRNRTFTITAGAGEYICFAYPNSYGVASFTVGGFEGGFTLLSDSISVTNAYGVTQDYRLYRSDNPSLGSTTVVVT